MRFKSYARNFEDVMLWRALKDIDNGFYIDAGAGDPLVDSATAAFYERGWSGINIEPSAARQERLCASRPRDVNLAVAVAEVVGEVDFFDVATPGRSTLDARRAAEQEKSGHQVARRRTPTTTLDQVCAEHVIGSIHFLRVGVEGAEQRVLQGLDLARWRPWILVIESTEAITGAAKHPPWEPGLLAAAYHLVYVDGLNRFYVANEQSGLDGAFLTPPNVFDDFVLVEGHHFSAPVPDLRALEERARSVEAWARDVEASRVAADAWTRQLEARLESSEAWMHEVQAWSASAEARVALVEGKVAVAQAQVEEAEARAVNVQARAQAAEDWARQTDAQAAARVQAAETLLADTLASLSWRITLPLRRASALVQRVFHRRE